MGEGEYHEVRSLHTKVAHRGACTDPPAQALTYKTIRQNPFSAITVWGTYKCRHGYAWSYTYKNILLLYMGPSLALVTRMAVGWEPPRSPGSGCI
jgi:hypothetical protein